MELFLFACMLVVLVVRWFQMRGPPGRHRVAVSSTLSDTVNHALADAVVPCGRASAAAPRAPCRAPEPPPAPAPAAAPAPPPPIAPAPAAQPVAARTGPPPAPVPWTDRMPRAEAPAPEPRRSRTSEDWEALLGGNWMNKIGVFVVVIGIALLLNYAYTHIGPAGRVALSYTGALAMLVAGVVVERREQLPHLRLRIDRRRMGRALPHHLRDACHRRRQGAG